MDLPGPSDLRVMGVAFQAPRGELRLTLSEDCRTGGNVPDMLYARDMRAGHDLYDLDPRLAEVLWYLLTASLGAFYVRFEDDGKVLALGIAPPEETNDYGLVNSGGYLADVLSSMVGQTPRDYAGQFGRMTDPDSTGYVGYGRAQTWALVEIPADVQSLLNQVLHANTLSMGPKP